MGVVKFFSSSLYDKPDRCNISKEEKIYSDALGTQPPNPNPENYTIIRSKVMKPFLIVEVNYPGCTTYEGNKILVFGDGITLSDLKKQGRIDPHFSDNKKFYSPLARFEPTKIGWRLAELMIKAVKKVK